jgi:hypothetical protein
MESLRIKCTFEQSAKKLEIRVVIDKDNKIAGFL